MSDTLTDLAPLRLALRDDPVRLARLFDIRDVGEFVAELARFAESIGCAVSDAELMAALRQGQRDWIERQVP